ncbi:MAG: porin, partial [Burkholderiales bacterium]
MKSNRSVRAAVLVVLALPLVAPAQEVSGETPASAKESTAVVSAGPKGVSLSSADGSNEFHLRGLLHLDGRYLPDDDAGVIDTFQATRVRPIFEGKVAEIIDFRLVPDFGQGRTVIQDAYVTARFNPAAQLTVGKFKSPVGLERLQSS